MIARKNLMQPVLLGLLALAALGMAACLESSSSPVRGVLTPPNGLGFGGSEDGIIVEFMGVVADSRCAKDVVCIQAGDATVKLGIIIGSSPRTEVELKVESGRETVYEADGKFVVKLQRLLPEPPPVGGVVQSAYQLELSIERK